MKSRIIDCILFGAVALLLLEVLMFCYEHNAGTW